MKEENNSIKIVNKYLIISGLVSLCLFFVAHFHVAATAGTSNAEIEQIRRERDSLRLDNEILSAKIDELKALPNLDELVAEYDLVEKNVKRIEANNNVAMN